jgi:hypothetical protein
MKEILRRQNLRPFNAEFSPASLLGVFACYCQRDLVDESGMIRTQMGNAQVFIHAHNRSVIVSALGTSFAKPLCNFLPCGTYIT